MFLHCKQQLVCKISCWQHLAIRRLPRRLRTLDSMSWSGQRSACCPEGILQLGCTRAGRWYLQSPCPPCKQSMCRQHQQSRLGTSSKNRLRHRLDSALNPLGKCCTRIHRLCPYILQCGTHEHRILDWHRRCMCSRFGCQSSCQL